MSVKSFCQITAEGASSTFFVLLLQADENMAGKSKNTNDRIGVFISFLFLKGQEAKLSNGEKQLDLVIVHQMF